jgi:nitrogen fixation protein NifU and related proteins
MELYTETIIDLAKNPLNRKILDKPTHTGSGVNTTCGDHVRLFLMVKNDVLEDASWEGDGCAISLASASVLTEELKGKRMDQISAFDKEALMQVMEIPTLGPARVKCLTLSLETLHNAVCEPKNLNA